MVSNSKAAYEAKRYEFIERMFNGLESVPIQQVIGEYVGLRQQGRHFMGLCPFHKSTKLGSFVVTPDKGLWKCFACGDGYAGNAVKFVSLYKMIPYLDAAFEVALDYGVITRSEYDFFSKKSYDASFVKNMERKYSEQANEEKPQRAAPEVIHNVYLLIKKLCPLTDIHRNKLVNERKLPEDRIAKDYFSFPTNWRQKDKIVEKIYERFPDITEDILKTVPGFFYDRKREKVSFSGYKGLGILIRNADGTICGIQIRKDTVKKDDSRYVWFSSNFAFYRSDEFSGGCGCGSPKDILWAKDLNRKTLCITEGRFKSEVLAANGNTTISIQGVTSWSGIESSIRDVMKRQKIDSLFVFLDSDIMGKHMLFSQSEKMCMSIHKAFPGLSIRYAFWHKDKGKGIDDFIHAGGKEISYVNVKDAVTCSDESFKKVLGEFGVSRMQELKQEDAEAFENRLQSLLEEKLVS